MNRPTVRIPEWVRRAIAASLPAKDYTWAVR